MRRLAGRVAVVTGAASGIGQALAARFAAEGMRCVLADVEEAALARAVGDLRRSGASVIGVRTDVADPAQVQALAGVIHGCRTFLPLLLQQDEAHIVNTSSMAALNGHPLGQAPYTTAKFGVLGLSQNLHFELAATTRGRVGVSVLIPGLTRTRIFASDRNRPATVPVPPPSSFRETSKAAIAGVWDCALDPDKVAGVVVDAVRARRFYILTHPDESFDMVEQQLRWMKTNVPLVPGPGVARQCDTDPRP